MNKDIRHASIVGGIGLLIILVYILFNRRVGGTTIINNDAPNFGDVSFGSGASYSRAPFSIPSFGSNPATLSMIGSCCMDCSSPRPTTYVPATSGNTYVFNEGARGGSTFNYFTPEPQKKVTSGGVAQYVDRWR